MAFWRPIHHGYAGKPYTKLYGDGGERHTKSSTFLGNKKDGWAPCLENPRFSAAPSNNWNGTEAADLILKKMLGSSATLLVGKIIAPGNLNP